MSLELWLSNLWFYSLQSHYILDRDGYIVWEAQGANPQNIKLLETMLERLVDGQPGAAGDPRT